MNICSVCDFHKFKNFSHISPQSLDFLLENFPLGKKSLFSDGRFEFLGSFSLTFSSSILFCLCWVKAFKSTRILSCKTRGRSIYFLWFWYFLLTKILNGARRNKLWFAKRAKDGASQVECKAFINDAQTNSVFSTRAQRASNLAGFCWGGGARVNEINWVVKYA